MEEFLDVMVVSIATICGEYYYPFVCQEYPFEWEQVDGESKRSSWFVLDGDRYVFHTFFFLKWFFLIVFVVVVVCLYLFILFVCLFVCWYLTYCNLLAWVLVWMFAHAAKLLLRQNQLTLSQNLS